MELKELTLKEIREKSLFGDTLVTILPWGSCEPHNLHLPYGCDTLSAEKIAKISSEKASKKGAKVLILPSIPIGGNSNTLRFPLTLNLSPSTGLKILEDIVYSLEKHNVRKLVILNGHGGNEFKPMFRELYGKTSVYLFLLNFWEIGNDIYREILDDTSGDHANEAETSWALYLFPELVHMEWADEGKVKDSRLQALNKGWVKITRPWHLFTENSGNGNPSKASKEKGKKIVEVITNRISSFLIELSKAEIDEKFPY